MEELLKQISQEFEAFRVDAQLLVEKGNKAAGARSRRSTLSLEKLLKLYRKVSVEESKK